MSKMTDERIANDGKTIDHIADDGKKVEEVIKALEFCSHCVCNDDKTETECPYYNMPFCKNYLRKQSLDVINRQQAEIERLKKAVEIHKGIAEDWKYEAKKLKEMVGEQQ